MTLASICYPRCLQNIFLSKPGDTSVAARTNRTGSPRSACEQTWQSMKYIPHEEFAGTVAGKRYAKYLHAWRMKLSHSNYSRTGSSRSLQPHSQQKGSCENCVWANRAQNAPSILIKLSARILSWISTSEDQLCDGALPYDFLKLTTSQTTKYRMLSLFSLYNSTSLH